MTMSMTQRPMGAVRWVRDDVSRRAGTQAMSTWYKLTPTHYR